MSIQIGVVMDPVATITPYKDTTLAMLLEAQKRDWTIHYMELTDLFITDGVPCAWSRPLKVRDDNKDWFELGEGELIALDGLDIILMRKDPPVDDAYIYATLVLTLADSQGVLVANQPDALRNWNEKLAITRYPHCTPPTLVDQNMGRLNEFIATHDKVVLKPLDGMGGKSVFVTHIDDPNRNVILETMTAHGQQMIMAQTYIPEIKEGDKRILMIGGRPAAYALARIPQRGESRANLAAGGKGVAVELTDRDRWICEQVSDDLLDAGLHFVGLDVIGDYLTEINVTSPTCVRELDAAHDLNIAGQFFDYLTAILEFHG